MGQVVHGSARTTAAVRRAVQASQASLRTLAKHSTINPKTVAKWKQRTHVDDLPMGPKEPHSMLLTPEQEVACVAFRTQTLRSLDDCLYALQSTIPTLTRSSLHRCFQRHRVSRLSDVKGDKPARKKFKKDPIGYFHIDITELRTEEGKLYLLVAIDRTSKYAYAELHTKYGKMEAAQFLRNLIAKGPSTIHTVLTDNGIQFTNRARDIYEATHIFDRVCREHDIEHRLTKVNHPWTNGQVERMNCTLKEATVNRYHDVSQQQLQEHLEIFLNAYNFAKRLKALQGRTAYEYIVSRWQKEPERFVVNPHHHNLGLNT